MILHNLINEKLHSATAKLILYAILEKAEFEKKYNKDRTNIFG